MYHSTLGSRKIKKKRRRRTKYLAENAFEARRDHPRFFDERLGSLLGAIDYVGGSGN